MFHLLYRTLGLLIHWLDLRLFTLVLSRLSFLPTAWLHGFYSRLFWSWCR